MVIYEELFAAFWLWLALVILVGVYVVRIASLLYHQRRVETAYRLHLAAVMGAAAREQRSEAGGRQ